MNREETRSRVEVMQAFIDGESILSTPVTEDIWMDDADPQWDFDAFYYRIKPKPREFWVREYTQSLEGTNVLGRMAQITEKTPQYPKAWIKVREVLE